MNGHSRTGRAGGERTWLHDRVAEQILGLRESIGISHPIRSIEWCGTPQGLVLETLRLAEEEVFPKVRAAL